jgi:hypothetical protein
VSRFLCAAATVLAAVGVSAPALGQQAVNLPARDQLLQVALTDVFKVGKAEGASWELYGERRRIEVAFDGTGNLHIFDPQNFRVVVVSPTGQFLREIGKQGEGPGELRSPAGFAVMRDGTVVVADFGARSFAIFDSQGAYQKSVPFGMGDGSLTVLGALSADPRGGSLISSGSRVMMMSVQGRGGGAAGKPTPPSGRPITRYPLSSALEGRLIHSAWQAPPVATEPQTITTGRGNAISLMGGARPRAFEPQLFSGVLPDGSVVFSDSSAYAIKVVGPDGGLRRIFQRPLRPRAVTPSMQEEEKKRRLDEMAAGGGPRMQINTAGPGGAVQQVPQAQIEQMLRQQVETLQFYPELPVVTGLTTGWGGKIWVSRRGSDVNGPGPIDVLSPTGEYQGTIAADGPRAPNAFGPNGLAAYVETDQFEVVQIVVRRLPAELR